MRSMNSRGRLRAPCAVRVLFGATLLLALATALQTGCIARPTNSARSPVVPTTGRMSYAGLPATGALVVLHPVESGSAGRPWTAGFPRGRVADDGSFQLTTYEQHDGAPAGRYVILVTWHSRTPPSSGEAERAVWGAESEDWLAGRFADPHVSRLSCVVEGPRADLGPIELR